MLGIADGISQFDFREIVSIKTFDVVLVGAGDGLLRLHDFQIICHSGGKAVLRLSERLFRQFDRATSDLDLLSGCVKIEQCGAYLVVNLAAEVAQLRTNLP